MYRAILLTALFSVIAAASAQRTLSDPRGPVLQTLPPSYPPPVLNPAPPPPAPLDLRTGAPEEAKLCTREVFAPCPDERSKNCFRKETYRCK